MGSLPCEPTPDVREGPGGHPGEGVTHPQTLTEEEMGLGRDAVSPGQCRGPISGD